MLKRPSDERLTLEERIAVIIAIAIAIGVHVAIFLGGSGISQLVREEKKRERLMVIRRVREITPPPEIAVRVPDRRRVQVAPEPVPADQLGGAPAPPKPDVKVSKHGTLPPPPKAEVSPAMEQDLQESLRKETEEKPDEQKTGQKSTEVGNTSLSVVTDLPSATFTVTGPAEYRGTGTFWIRRGALPGTYRIIFSPVEGFGTPPPQTRELPEKGQIVFVGKYKHSTEVIVEANVSSAQFTIYRPDGRTLDMSRPGRAFFDDLPPGTYTVVFKEVSGYNTPAPLSRTLSAGSSLIFTIEYKETLERRPSSDSDKNVLRGRAQETQEREGEGTRRGGKVAGQGGPREAMLDRRVQLVVSSTPRTGIEESHPPIAYPEVAIRKSNFQQGWCQVYLVVWVKSSGEVGEIVVERPSPETRKPYEALIKAVEESVRDWDYDKVRAEVHIDARFYVE